MSYNAELILQQDQTTSNWSGGTTTQIAIFPKLAVYAERNFIWRISSARVELEESEFTSLPGIWRHIMVLDGEMRLEHAGHHNCYLKPYEQDSFSGDWTTKSFGKVRDFNLMLARGSTGNLTATSLAPYETAPIDLHSFDSNLYSQKTTAFYCVDGALTINISCDIYKLTPGDMLLITSSEPTNTLQVNIINTRNEFSHIVKSDINY